MIRFYCFILLVVFLSCKNDSVSGDILPEAKMREVLWDIMRADEWVSYEYSKDSSLNKFNRSTELYQQVFQIHKIKADQFKKSIQYYQEHPQMLKPVLDSIQQRANNLPGKALQ